MRTIKIVAMSRVVLVLALMVAVATIAGCKKSMMNPKPPTPAADDTIKELLKSWEFSKVTLYGKDSTATHVAGFPQNQILVLYTTMGFKTAPTSNAPGTGVSPDWDLGPFTWTFDVESKVISFTFDGGKDHVQAKVAKISASALTLEFTDVMYWGGQPRFPIADQEYISSQ